MQIIAALKQVEAGRTVEDVARERGDDLYLEGEFGGMDANNGHTAQKTSRIRQVT